MTGSDAEARHKEKVATKEDDTKDHCNLCKAVVEANEDAVECEYCNRWQHYKCADLTAGEFQMLQRSRCKLTWLCSECKPRLISKTIDLQGQSLEAKSTSETQPTCKELERRMEDLGKSLMEKMSLLLETQLQQTELLTTMHQNRPTVIQEGKTTGNKPEEIRHEEQAEQAQQQKEGEGREKGAAHATSYARAIAREPNDNRKEAVMGTMVSADFQAGRKRAWLYVGKVHRDTSAEQILRHLQKQGIKDESECEELPTRGHLKAFKVGIPFEQRERATTPEFWPMGVLVRQYIFRGRRPEGGQFA